MKEENVKKAVRDSYAKVAAGSSCGCGSSSGSCCSPVDTAKDISSNMGYSAEELERLPEGANLGLGLRQSSGNCFTEKRRSCSGPWFRCRNRLLSGSGKSRP